MYYTHGTSFIKFMDATNEFQSGKYIYGLTDDIVETISENRIVQVVRDNGVSYKAAGQLLMQKRRHYAGHRV